MNIDWEDKEPAGIIKEDYLNSFLNKYPNTPQIYIDFIKEVNGGIPKNRSFTFYNEVEEEDIPTEFVCFYPLTNENIPRGPNLKSYYQSVQYVKENIMDLNDPENPLIPIGQDIAGNLLCISLTDKEDCTVYFYDHEYEELYKLSQDIEGFINKLGNPN